MTIIYILYGKIQTLSTPNWRLVCIQEGEVTNTPLKIDLSELFIVIASNYFHLNSIKTKTVESLPQAACLKRNLFS